MTTTAQLEQLDVPVKSLHPNPWNPNKQSEREYAAEIESIKTFGFIDPITVRRHPKKKDAYQIIDGEHRYKAAQEIGIDTVPVIVLDVGDPEAKRLTIILNETRGIADRVDLGVLLADLEATIGLEELSVGLPFTDDSLKNLIELGSTDLPDFGSTGGDPGDPEPPADPNDQWKSVWMRVPLAVAEMWDDARDAIEKQAGTTKPHQDEHVRNGLAFELLLADWNAAR